MKKSKIKSKVKLIIFPGNFLPHVGGLETHVDEFAKYLSKDEDYEVTIFSPDVIGAKEKETIYKKVKVIRYPAFEIVHNFPMPKFWKPLFWRLFLGLYKNDYDIVMTRTRFFVNSTLGMFFAKFRLWRRLKLVHVEHGSDFVKLNSSFKSFVSKVYDRTFGWLNFALANRNIAISSAVYDFIRNEFVKKKEIPIIRRGIDMENIDKYKEDKELRGKIGNKVILCYIGRLYKWKGVANAIDAYKKLPKEVKDKSVFVIGGYGEDLDRLKKLADKDLDSKIFFLGKVPFGKNYSIMKTSDIHIHSAYPGGGLSSTLLQFMYCKCAVVASPNEGAKDVIFNNKNSILLKDNSVNELKKGMEILIRDSKLRKKYAQANHDYIKENFSWNKVIDDYKKVFDEVMIK